MNWSCTVIWLGGLYLGPAFRAESELNMVTVTYAVACPAVTQTPVRPMGVRSFACSQAQWVTVMALRTQRPVCQSFLSHAPQSWAAMTTRASDGSEAKLGHSRSIIHPLRKGILLLPDCLLACLSRPEAIFCWFTGEPDKAIGKLLQFFLWDTYQFYLTVLLINLITNIKGDGSMQMN